MAEAVQMGEDLKFLSTAQRLAAAKEEQLGVDTATLVILKDELPTTEQMKKKKRRKTTKHPSYLEEKETQEEDKEPGEYKESRSSRAEPRGPHCEQVCLFTSVYHLCFGLCLYSTAGLGLI